MINLSAGIWEASSDWAPRESLCFLKRRIAACAVELVLSWGQATWVLAPLPRLTSHTQTPSPSFSFLHQQNPNRSYSLSTSETYCRFHGDDVCDRQRDLLQRQKGHCFIIFQNRVAHVILPPSYLLCIPWLWKYASSVFFFFFLAKWIIITIYWNEPSCIYSTRVCVPNTQRGCLIQILDLREF